MPESNPLQPGQKFGNGRFVLVRALGRGGMGEVWLAQDERLHEQVALKFLPSEIRGDPVALDDLRRETARSHKLTHPNIVRIHDLHEDADGTAFIVMEYIDGPTLASLRLEQPNRVFAWSFLRPLLEQLCAALDYAHGEKVIHRDLKPANMMVDSRGRLKLADFGIAAVASDSMSRVSAQRTTSGTLLYMSPQQLAGKRAQVTDDIYALGATLYELLTSQPPFHTGDLTHQVLHEAPEPLAERWAALAIQNAIPADVAAMIMACLAKEPGQRPQSALAVAEWTGLEVVRKPSLEALSKDVFSGAPPGAPEIAVAAPAASSSGTKSLWAIGVFAALLLLAAGGWYWAKQVQGKKSRGAENQTKSFGTNISTAPGGEAATTAAGESQAPIPDTSQLHYGMYIWFSIPTFARDEDKGRIPAERFAPTLLDVHDWVRVARDAGMTFAILTAKHSSGFCLWDSPDYDYDIGNSPFKRDLIGEFVAACKDGGIVPGVHYSISDSYDEGDNYWGPVSRLYFAVIKKQVAELETRYPDLRVLIFDLAQRLSPAQMRELRQLVKQLNPNCAIWNTTEGIFGGPKFQAASVIRSYTWSPNSGLNPAWKLLRNYNKTQADGKAFVLNVGPDQTGRIPVEQVAALMDLKKLMANLPATNAPDASMQRWTNSLGMVLVPVPGTQVRFSIWDTRVKDYAAYATAKSGVDSSWKRACQTNDYANLAVTPGPDNPVVFVSWNDAQTFCDWLTGKELLEGWLREGQYYRLPTDTEWSCAVGIGDHEKGNTSEEKSDKLPGVYPWGTEWPPPSGAGNYADMSQQSSKMKWKFIEGYDDGYPTTSPVGSFKPNKFGIYDLGGNVQQWCQNWYNRDSGKRVLRGASWLNGYSNALLSSHRFGFPSDGRLFHQGFRVVLAEPSP